MSLRTSELANYMLIMILD